jgi:non-ribosomal peptide synthetase component F
VRQLASTETSVLASQLIDDATTRIGDSVPVGYPVPGKELWLENEAGMRCGPGEIGEIVVRSRYLFKGVWRRPATWCGPGQARLHRTGDLARWLADGNLEFVGRRDSRVKVRGFTVDLEHVEAGIEATGLVDEVAVVAPDDPGGDATLVAYFVPRHGTSVKLLRARLAEALPDFMLPTQFVPLDSLPLTPTGKLHRAALPKLNLAASSGAGSLPRSSLEAQVAAVWREALGRGAIGIEEDFLEIGGDSLTAARIVSRILATLGVELTPRDLFVAPTITQMAELIAARQAHREVAPRPEIVPRAGPPIVP